MPNILVESEFGDVLSELSQEDKVYNVNQLILDLMDYTEQSDDEKLWCDLLKEFQKLVDKYNIKLQGYNCPLDSPEQE